MYTYNIHISPPLSCLLLLPHPISPLPSHPHLCSPLVLSPFTLCPILVSIVVHTKFLSVAYCIYSGTIM